VCDPQPETRGIALCEDAYQAAEGADALFLLTPWPAFQDLDLNRLRQGMRRPLMIDAHNYLDARAARAAGLRYRGVGIPEPLEAPTGVGIGGRP
jgi:UDPglucose 6-dehydrogenase